MKMSDDSIIYCLENLAGYEPDDIDCDDVDIAVNDDQFGSMSIVRTAALGAEMARRLTEENQRLREALEGMVDQFGEPDGSDFINEADYTVVSNAKKVLFMIKRGGG